MLKRPKNRTSEGKVNLAMKGANVERLGQEKVHKNINFISKQYR